MIEAVFFDYDGVLTTDKTGTLTTCRYLSACTGIAVERLRAALQPYNHELTVGRRSYADVWPDVCRRLGRPIPFDLLAAAFDSTPMNDAMLALAARLKQRCTVGIVTDNKSDRMARLRRLQGLDARFDPIVVSAEVGCTKHEEAIFRIALQRAGVAASRSVFIDNAEDNLIAARAVGMETVHFDDEVNDVQGLAETLRRLCRPSLGEL
jgi:putative hydrolase of the HAD superfamily